MLLAPGENHLARHAGLRSTLRAASLDALIVTSLPNIAYLTGLFASTAALVIGDAELRLIVDARYLAMAEARRDELPELSLTLVSAAGSFEDAIAEAASRYRPGRIGIEASHMTVRQYRHLETRLAPQGGAVTIQGTDGLVENLRAVKDPWEIGRLREGAARLSDAAKCIIQKP